MSLNCVATTDRSVSVDVPADTTSNVSESEDFSTFLGREVEDDERMESSSERSARPEDESVGAEARPEEMESSRTRENDGEPAAELDGAENEGATAELAETDFETLDTLRVRVGLTGESSELGMSAQSGNKSSAASAKDKGKASVKGSLAVSEGAGRVSAESESGVPVNGREGSPELGGDALMIEGQGAPVAKELMALSGGPTDDAALLNQEGLFERVATVDQPENAAGRSNPLMADALAKPSEVSEQTLRFEELVERFDQRLLSMVQKSDNVMRISVSPEAMGRLTVVCREENATLMVEVMTESLSVRNLVAEQEGAIRQLMQANAIELGGFDVSLNQGESDPRSFQEGWSEQARSRGIEPAFEEEEELQSAVHAQKSGAVSLIA